VDDATGGCRRELRKAQTRAEVRAAAQRLFAERGFDAVTIADVAAAADVAVQTVFNHFESKEALFFDGRTPWVEGIAASVAQRPAGHGPLAAVRAYLDADLTDLLQLEARSDNRSYVEALDRSPGLRAGERGLVEQAWERLAEALLATVADGVCEVAEPDSDPTTAEVLSRLASALLLTTGRVLVLEHRRLLLEGASEASLEAVRQLTTAALSMVQVGVQDLARQLLDPPAEQPG
jgi:AcrR family transcriptional regulator